MGPLLFAIHFNDVHMPLQSSSIITYADDTVIFTAGKDLDIIQRRVNEDLDNMSYWFRDNELVLNLKKGKTECMLGTAKRLNSLSSRELSITINGTLINNTSSYKYLGVNLDPSLNLGLYFEKMYKRAAGIVILLRRIRPLIDTSSAKNIHRAMIQPIFNYSGSLILNIYDSRKLKEEVN